MANLLRASHGMLPWPAIVALLGCQGEPNQNCDRVRFVWPYFELDSNADNDPETKGIQIDFDLRSDLLGETPVQLSIAEADGDPTIVSEEVANEDGIISFTGITVPEGDIIFRAQGSNSCGSFRTGKRTYVWDGRGLPRCELSLPKGPTTPLVKMGAIVLGNAQDEEPETPGLQLLVRVESGRPDTDINLFVVDRTRASSQTYKLGPDNDGTAEQVVTLMDGTYAMRSICSWEPQDLHPTSPTWVYKVDTSGP